jgi:prepilin-type N-terminal cleavage/methylation domain-containing protein
MTRRGVTLIELAMSLVLLGLVAALYATVVLSGARPAARAIDHMVSERTIDAVYTFLSQEWRDAGVNDLIVTTSHVVFSRPVGEATVCADSGSAVLIADTGYVGTRMPQARRDQVALLAAADSTWQFVALDTVTAARCPSSGDAALRLGVPMHAGSAVALRVVEPVDVSVYRSSGADWYGLAPADHSATVQPFAGPLVLDASTFRSSAAAVDVVVAPAGATALTLHIPMGRSP